MQREDVGLPIRASLVEGLGRPSGRMQEIRAIEEGFDEGDLMAGASGCSWPN
jgi:hypothetical protein